MVIYIFVERFFLLVCSPACMTACPSYVFMTNIMNMLGFLYSQTRLCLGKTDSIFGVVPVGVVVKTILGFPHSRRTSVGEKTASF